ncbi:MAG: 1-acyl-sn-glycerol-3-phosphate acyltransferase, partial [Flavobacterium sp.]|nr:1-acyl-sn-glycerol-3-phosphate acyltransferase [Flavobacterium sp.]
DEISDIVTKIEYAIEQHPSFLKVISTKEYAEQEDELHKKRKFWNL